ncbi:MAG TPA: hypothetical protein VF789_05505 [Thermoanaerobaculia bacterium]
MRILKRNSRILLLLALLAALAAFASVGGPAPVFAGGVPCEVCDTEYQECLAMCSNINCRRLCNLANQDCLSDCTP